ncbi:hypothetical protein SLS55_005481 [Diplodia seriata]|uniref:DUF7730 domain-containing protein n=1 Tax=Diplodia seriata TaxID=420778 RepID=A0ABR3CHJ6_9PEZI
MTSKRQRYLYRPVYHGLVRPLGYCLLAPLVIVVIVADLWCARCNPHTVEDGSWPLTREWVALCDRLEKQYTPTPLLPVAGHDADEKEAHAQHQSPFFAKLPAELRMRIYHEILGGNVFHLLLKPGRIGHVACTRDHSAIRAPRDPDRRCIAAYTAPRELQQQRDLLAKSKPPLTVDHCPVFALNEYLYFLYSTHHRAHDDYPPYPDCPDIFHHQHYRCPLHQPQSMSHINVLPSHLLPNPNQPDPTDHSKRPRRRLRRRRPANQHPWPPPTSSVTGLLAILLSCRRAHREAAPTLYQANVFDANHPQTLTLFATTIPPPRLASIRELQVRWTWRLRHRPTTLPPTFWWAQLWRRRGDRRDGGDGGGGPVARMTGLRCVYLSLELEGYRPPAGQRPVMEEAKRGEVLTKEEEMFLGPVADVLRGAGAARREETLRRVEVFCENEGDDGVVRESVHPPSAARVWLEGAAGRWREARVGGEEGDERREEAVSS